MRNHRHRRRMIVLLCIAVVAIVWVIYAMIVDFRSRPVEYSIARIKPMVTHLCPGEVLRYDVSLAATQVPTVLEITESWCRTGLSGICSRELTATYKVPVLEQRSVYTIANRVMPRSNFFRPGDEVEMWHATTDGRTVTGYRVGPITIRDDCETPEGGVGGN